MGLVGINAHYVRLIGKFNLAPSQIFDFSQLVVTRPQYRKSVSGIF